MADIGRLLLPPPNVPPPNAAARTIPARIGAGSVGRVVDDEQNLAARVDEAADATSGARGKHFLFRVLDGARNDSLAGNAEVPARADKNAQYVRDGNIRDENVRDRAASTGHASGNFAGSDRGAAGAGSDGIPLGTPAAAFLAQLIAQEQLPPGLYDPPTKAADRAYRQAGAEPPLSSAATVTPRFRLAV